MQDSYESVATSDKHALCTSTLQEPDVAMLGEPRRWERQAQETCHLSSANKFEQSSVHTPSGLSVDSVCQPRIVTHIRTKVFCTSRHHYRPGRQFSASERFVTDDQVIRLKVIHIPEHRNGQMAYLCARNGGLLFAANRGANIPRLEWSLGYEGFEEGKRRLDAVGADISRRLCRHYKAIKGAGWAVQTEVRFKLIHHYPSGDERSERPLDRTPRRLLDWDRHLCFEKWTPAACPATSLTKASALPEISFLPIPRYFVRRYSISS